MRTVAILLLASAGLFAQPNVTSPSGFGRILYPGGGPPASVGVGGFGRNIYPGVATVNSPGAPPVQNTPGHGQGIVAVPYPVYVGGGYAYTNPSNTNWNWGIPQQSTNQAQFANYVPVSPQQEPPVVIVNQYFNSDQAPARQVSQTAPVAAPAPVAPPQLTPTNQDRDVIFMIAMKDHTIYAASAYWVEDGALNYVTIQGDQNSVSMDLVDRDLSQRLNRDRRIAFGLPTR